MIVVFPFDYYDSIIAFNMYTLYPGHSVMHMTLGNKWRDRVTFSNRTIST